MNFVTTEASELGGEWLAGTESQPSLHDANNKIKQ